MCVCERGEACVGLAGGGRGGQCSPGRSGAGGAGPRVSRNPTRSRARPPPRSRHPPSGPPPPAGPPLSSPRTRSARGGAPPGGRRRVRAAVGGAAARGERGPEPRRRAAAAARLPRPGVCCGAPGRPGVEWGAGLAGEAPGAADKTQRPRLAGAGARSRAPRVPRGVHRGSPDLFLDALPTGPEGRRGPRPFLPGAPWGPGSLGVPLPVPAATPRA